MINDFLNYLVALHILAAAMRSPTLTEGDQDFQRKGEKMTFEALRTPHKDYGQKAGFWF